MDNRWFNINGKLVKNPDKKDFDGLEKHQYVEYIQGSLEDLIVETWWVDIANNRCINFTYMPSVLRLCNMTLSEMRNLYFKQHNVNPTFDRSYTLPPSYFTEDSVRIPKY